MHKKKGTPYYIAPEVIKRNYNEKCDVWSCGVILYIMICGYPPFNGKSNKDIMKNILKGKFYFRDKDWGHISRKCKQMIKKMLTVDVERRLTAFQALKFGWIKKMGKIRVSRKKAKHVLTNLKNFRATRKL